MYMKSFFSLLLMFYIFIVYANAKYIEESSIDKTKYTLQVSSCPTWECSVLTTFKFLKYEQLNTKELDGKYITSIVNIKNISEANKLQQKYIKIFPDLILGEKPFVPTPIVKKKKVKKKKEKVKQTPSKEKSIVDKYKIALTNFKNKKYEKAYKLFYELFQENLNDANINFYLGRSAFETKRYHEAIIAYERVLFEKPESSRTKLEMARAYFLNNSFNESKRLFLDVKNDPNVPINVLSNIKKYLMAIESKITRHSIGGILIAGVNYDSNVNSSAALDIWIDHTKNILNLPVDENNTVNNNYESAWAHQEIVLVNYGYKISDDKQAKTDFMGFNKNMFDSNYKSKDIKLMSLTQTLSMIYSKQLSVDYGVFVDNMWLANINNVRTFGLLPKFTFIDTNNDVINGYLKYQVKSHHQSVDKGKDSIYMELGASLTRIKSSKIILMPAIVYSKEKKKSGIQTGIDKSSISLALNGTYIYNPTLIFAPSISYKQTSAVDEDSAYKQKPKDKEIKLGLAATYIHNPKSIFQGGISYIDQTSNIPLNKYDKYTFMINFIRPF